MLFCLMTSGHFTTGVWNLLHKHSSWLSGRRVGLLSHAAALDRCGASSLELLLQTGCRLVAVFGPEHGFQGAAPAGQKVSSRHHHSLNIPVYSLYGKHRRPTRAMLRNVDCVVCDLQDLGSRPYTYVSTLFYMMEAACQLGIQLIVADRPIPLPMTIDGPMLQPAFTSFVGCVPVPMAYGMTPGETALWLKSHFALDLDLRVARMSGWPRQANRGPDWPAWLPPSPGIRSWDSAQCYLATVFAEAIPSIDNGRGTSLAFRVIGASWLPAKPLCDELNKMRQPGVSFHIQRYEAGFTGNAGRILEGVRININRPQMFMPVRTSVAILSAIQALCGKGLWRRKDTRTEFFDKLYGTDTVRRSLQRGLPLQQIVHSWQRELKTFAAARQAVLQY